MIGENSPLRSFQILALEISSEVLKGVIKPGSNITLLNERLIKNINNNRSEYNLHKYKELNPVQSTCFDNFTDRQFEGIVIGNAVNLRKNQLFDDIKRVLKPGGCLAFADVQDNNLLPEHLKHMGFEFDECKSSLFQSAATSFRSCARPKNTDPGVPQRSILRTERLYMRPWRREDLDFEDEWPNFDNPIYRHYNPPRDPKERRDLRFKKIARLFDLKLSIFNDDKLVGYIALFGTDMDKLESEMGINFAANHCSKGYCKESLKKLCDEFFFHWGMKRMRLEVAVFNEYGIRCYQRCGFKETKRFWNPKAPQRLIYHEGNSEFTHVAKHFRRGEAGYEVEFMEMAATKEEYINHFKI